MVIHDRVYDVTKFASQHPGGVEVLFECGGIDATEAFEDVGHSEGVLNMLVPYYVGSLAPEDRKCKTKSHEASSEGHKSPHANRLGDKESDRAKTEVTGLVQLDGPRKQCKSGPNSNVAFVLFTALAISSLLLYLGLQRAKVHR